MTMKSAEPNPLVINSSDRMPDWNLWDHRVRKIVLGPSSIQTPEVYFRLTTKDLPNLAQRFPEMTHLYLWRVKGLTKLPTLPPGLKCLDLRGCRDLATLPELPGTLETLLLDNCANLVGESDAALFSLPKLTELSVRGCLELTEDWVHSVLESAPALHFFDASQCPQITALRSWPKPLDRLELNGCSNLQILPGKWPVALRRLGLRGCAALSEIPDLPKTIDYLDLAGTEGLHALPVHWGRPRTLFLHRSGLLMPPASEHGKDADENVAERTRAYFEDVDLVGQG
jgi:hypothetical protein